MLGQFDRALTEVGRIGESRAVPEERLGGSLSSLREFNRLRVLDVVRERGPVSRAEIARETGLARSTVSSLIGELQGGGLVVERAAERRARAPRLAAASRPVRAGRRCCSRSIPRPAACSASSSTTAASASRWPICRCGSSPSARHRDRRRQRRRPGARGGGGDGRRRARRGRGRPRGRARSGRGAGRPDRPVEHRRRLLDPARLGRARPRHRARRADRPAGPPRQRRQPRRARRVRARRRAGRAPSGLRDALLGHRRRPGDRRQHLPRCAGDGR